MAIELLDTRSGAPLSGLAIRDGWASARGLRASNSTEVLAARVAAARARGTVLAARRDGRLAGLVAARESQWDADGLGRPVVTVDLATVDAADADPRELATALTEGLDAFVRERRSALDWLRLDAREPALLDVLLRRGFGIVDVILSLVREESRLERPRAGLGVLVRDARPDDAPWLRALAGAAFSESRFRDPRGPPAWHERTYGRWIDSRLEQRGPDLAFLVAEVENARAGFLIWKIHAPPGVEGRVGQVDLIATEPAARGRGTARALFDEARRRSGELAWMAADVYARNRLGLALHQRYGLEVACSAFYLHRWHEES